MRRFLPAGMLLLLTLLSASLAYAQSLTDPSPAIGHAEVVAQGVDGFVAANLRWQVRSRKVDATKEPLAIAGPGFVVADKGSVSVLTAIMEERLAPGEAAYVPASGATILAVSTTVATIETVELADATSSKPSGTRFLGESFPALSGLRDLDLVRDVLKANEQSQIANGDAPAVVLVIKGAVAVANASGGTLNLTDGKAGALTGPLTVTATGSASAVFYVGVIGPEVPAIGDGGASVPGGSGRINIVTYLCPTGVSVAAATPETCGRGSGPDTGGFSLTGGSLDSPRSPREDHGVWTWANLDAGDYTMSVTTFPIGYPSFAIDLNDYAAHDGSAIQVSLPEGEEVTINVYFLASDGTGNSAPAIPDLAVDLPPVGQFDD